MTWFSTEQLAAKEKVTPRAIRKRIARGYYQEIRREKELCGATYREVIYIKDLTDEKAEYPLREGFVSSPVFEEKTGGAPFSAKTKTDKKQALWDIYKKYRRRYNKTEAIRRAAKKSGKSERTFWRLTQNANSGRGNLLDMGGGVILRTECPEKCAKWFIGRISNDPKVSIHWLYNEMVCLAKIEESGLYKQRIPNIASFYRLAKQFKEKYSILITRANRGKKGLKTSVPPIRRDKTQYHVLEKVVGDQHIFDFIVRLPNGDFIRPQGYFWFDMRSRYCVGMSLQHGPYNKYNIGQSLRQVFQHGVPGAIYTDWGKPETSAYIDEIVAQAKEYGAYCGSMKEIRAIVRNPQAKPIESHFGKVEKWLYEVVGGVGYCKRNTADPQADEEMIRRLKTAKKKNKILSFEEFMNALALVLARWNKHEIRTEKIIPEQVFQQGLETAKKLGHVRILSDNALEVMFFPKLNRTVRQMQVQATLPLGKDRYHIVWASSELAGWEGKKVVVRYSPSAPERSLIFDQKGNYICEAEEWASINPKDQSTVQEKMSRQNQLIKDVDAQYQEIVSNAKDFQGVMAQSVAFSILAKSGDKSIDLKEAGQTKTQTAQKRKQNTIHKYDKIQTSQEKKKKTKKTQDSALDFFQEMRTRFSNIS